MPALHEPLDIAGDRWSLCRPPGRSRKAFQAYAPPVIITTEEGPRTRYPGVTCKKCLRRRHELDNPTEKEIREARAAILRMELSTSEGDRKNARDQLALLERGKLKTGIIRSWAAQWRGLKRQQREDRATGRVPLQPI